VFSYPFRSVKLTISEFQNFSYVEVDILYFKSGFAQSFPMQCFVYNVAKTVVGQFLPLMNSTTRLGKLASYLPN